MKQTRLFRNRPGLMGTVLMGCLGTMGLLHHVWNWSTIRSAIPEHQVLEGLPLTALLCILLAFGLSRLVQEIEVDPLNSLVTVRFGLSGRDGQTVTFSRDEWRLEDVHAVGIMYVHRGPAALHITGAGQMRRIATFYVRESKARDLGREISSFLGVPFLEIDGLGNKIRRLA